MHVNKRRTTEWCESLLELLWVNQNCLPVLLRDVSPRAVSLLYLSSTKNAMVMPFIQLLGYNVFDPLEVTPELIADIGTRRVRKLTMRFFGMESQSCSS